MAKISFHDIPSMEKISLRDTFLEISLALEELHKAAEKINIDQVICDNFLTDTGELRPLILEYKEKAFEAMMTRANLPKSEAHFDLKCKEKGFNTINALLDLQCRMEDNHERFLKYKVPGFSPRRPQHLYVSLVREFMEVWQKEVEEGRRKGNESLYQSLQRIHESDNVRLIEALETMRMFAVHAGINISNLLAMYFVLTAISAQNWDKVKPRFHTVYEAVKSLKVDNDSIIIETFLAALRYMYKTLGEFELAKRGDEEKASERVVTRKNESESEVSLGNALLHLIFREVLRLEVAFFCPSIPLISTVEGFLQLRSTMRAAFVKTLDNAFKKKEEMRMKVRQSAGDEEVMRFSSVTRLMLKEMQTIWIKLEVKPSMEESTGQNFV